MRRLARAVADHTVYALDLDVHNDKLRRICPHRCLKEPMAHTCMLFPMNFQSINNIRHCIYMYGPWILIKHTWAD